MSYDPLFYQDVEKIQEALKIKETGHSTDLNWSAINKYNFAVENWNKTSIERKLLKEKPKYFMKCELLSSVQFAFLWLIITSIYTFIISGYLYRNWEFLEGDEMFSLDYNNNINFQCCVDYCTIENFFFLCIFQAGEHTFKSIMILHIPYLVLFLWNLFIYIANGGSKGLISKGYGNIKSDLVYGYTNRFYELSLDQEIKEKALLAFKTQFSELREKYNF